MAELVVRRLYTHEHTTNNTADSQEHASHVAVCCRHRIVRGTHGAASRAFICVGEGGGSLRVRVRCSWLGRVHVMESSVVRSPAKQILTLALFSCIGLLMIWLLFLRGDKSPIAIRSAGSTNLALANEKMAFFVIANSTSYTQLCLARAEVRVDGGWNLYVPDAEEMDTNSRSFRMVPPHDTYTFSTLIPSYGSVWRVSVRHFDSNRLPGNNRVRTKVGFRPTEWIGLSGCYGRSGAEIQYCTTSVMEVGSLAERVHD